MKLLAKYVLVGVFNTLFGYLVIFAMMYGAGLTPLWSNAVGYGTGLVVSYGLNKWYTFQSRQKSCSEFIRFVLVFLVAYGINVATLMVSIDVAGIHAGLSQLVAGAAYVGSSFLMQKHIVFKAGAQAC